MDYKNIYDQLIENALNREIDGYTENHHIIPRCMGGTDDDSNLIRLTSKEHFIAHHLLWKEYRTTKLAHAFFMMTIISSNQSRYVNARLYEKAKQAHIEALKISMKGEGNNFYGRKHNKESLEKISAANKGKKHTQEFKDSVSRRFKGVPKSADHKKKIGRKGLLMVKNIKTDEVLRITKSELNLLDDSSNWWNLSAVAGAKDDTNRLSIVKKLNSMQVKCIEIDGIVYKSRRQAQGELGLSKYYLKKMIMDGTIKELDYVPWHMLSNNQQKPFYLKAKYLIGRGYSNETDIDALGELIYNKMRKENED